jgi:hypothetical protein
VVVNLNLDEVAERDDDAHGHVSGFPDAVRPAKRLPRRVIIFIALATIALATIAILLARRRRG